MNEKKLPILAISLHFLAAVVILFVKALPQEFTDISKHSRRGWTGEAHLISENPLGGTPGNTCSWQPVSMASQAVEPVPPSGNAAAMDRPPRRIIHDPNPSFSSLAVEPESNMVVVTDENLFQVLEYARTDNTPASSRMTEPRRVISGNLTKAEMMCGAYIDPKTLETYVVNNDTQNWLAVFSKGAKGNVAPDRFLSVPHGTFGIAVDEHAQEMFLTVQHDNTVMVYAKTAAGRDKPLRVLAGDDTQLEDPHGVAVDSRRGLLVVANHGSVSYRGKSENLPERPGSAPDEGGNEVGSTARFESGSGKFEPPSLTIYSLKAQGNERPVRVIEGVKTRLNWPGQIAVDEQAGEIYVANDMDHSVSVFKISDAGDVAPTRLISGPRTTIRNPTGIALDMKHREVWVANMGNHTAVAFAMSAVGNIPPLRTIRGGAVTEPSLMIGNPGAVAFDTKRKEVLVPN